MGHVHVIATQHLDVAWLWTRVPQGEDLMRQCFERAIVMIEAYPDKHFVFSRSTAWSFWIVQQRYPDLFEHIRHYVQNGRIELCGGEWVEPDHLIPSGESLIRQAALGQWYFQETFGKLARVCWDPDIFGHAHTLPQIIKKTGMDGYYFHRCRPRDAEDRPLHQFVWEGLDGTRIFVLSGQWVSKPDARVVRQAAAEIAETGLPATHVVTGLRSDRRMTMQRDWVPLPEVADQDPDLPACSWSTAEQVLAHMETYENLLPVIHGELDYQYTGTYTSNGFNKRANRELEELLLSAEKAAAWATLYGFPDQEAQLNQAWRDLCVNQFHDIICGTSYAEVHTEDRHLFAGSTRRAQWVRDQALAFLGDRIHAACPSRFPDQVQYAVFDFATWPRRTAVTLPVPHTHKMGDYHVLDRDESDVPSQPVIQADGSPGLLVFHSGEGLGYKRYALAPGKQTRTDVKRAELAFIVQDRGSQRLCLENNLLRVEIDPQTAGIVRLFDKRLSMEMLPPGGVGNQLVLLRDGGLLPHGEMHCWEPWNIQYTGELLDMCTVSNVELVDSGPLRGRFRLARRMQLEPDMPETVIIQDIWLDDDSPLVNMKMHGTWHARQVMLKAYFDLPFYAQSVAVDVPYGTAERLPNTTVSGGGKDADSLAEDRKLVAQNVPEPDRYMQKWLDATDGERGLLFLNNGRYGYDALPQRIGLSLLRAPFMRPEKDEVIGLGPFSFSYALYPHLGNWRAVDAPRLGYGYNTEPVVVPVQPGTNDGVGCGWWDILASTPAGIPGTLLSVSGSGVIGTVLKQAHNGQGVIVRLYESLGSQTEALLSFCHPVRSMSACDMLERNTDETLDIDGSQVKVVMDPFEIKTLRVVLQVNETVSKS
ncbi:MAG: glycoside hydrolase family 38 C-terminal domain-containing protein [Anaerolineae bacterium]|nr:glycoside hydrolase family 38 C-terminal domain-containing protein [Anaerolineae bacterium]